MIEGKADKDPMDRDCSERERYQAVNSSSRSGHDGEELGENAVLEARASTPERILKFKAGEAAKFVFGLWGKVTI